MGERPQQTINPQAFAIQAGLAAVPKKKKKEAEVLSTPMSSQPLLKVPPQQSQAPTVATPSPVVTPKIGGISSSFGATNINAEPKLGWATVQDIGKQQKIINSQPKTPEVLPETGVDKTVPQKVDIKSAIAELGTDIKKGATLQEVKESYPEFQDLDDSVLGELWADISRWATLEEIIEAYPELGGKSIGEWNILTDNFITDLGSWVGQSAASYGKLGKKLGIKAGNALRPVFGKEKYSKDELSAMYDNSDTTVDQITNRQTPEQKETIAGGVWEAVGTVGQALVMPTGVSTLSKIPAVAKVASKAPVASSIVKGALQGIVGQEQYNLATEWRMSTGKELATAWVIGAAIPWAGAAAKGIMKGVKKLPQFFGKQAENLAVKGLLNTSDAKNILRTLDETADGDVGSIGRWALNKWVAGQKTEDAVKSLQKIHGDTYTQVREVVDETSNKLGALGKNADVEKSMELVTKSMAKANKDIGYKAYDLAEAKAIQQAAKDWTLTLNQAQKSKELIDEFQNIYKKSQDVLSTQLAKEGAKLRTNIRKFIEDKVTIGTNGGINLKELNRDVAVAKAFEKGILSKSVANELKQYAIQWSVWGLVGNQWDFSSPEGIAKFLVGAFMGRQIGKVLGNPAVLGKIAKMVDKLSMWSRNNLLQYIKAPSTAVLTKNTIDELTNIKSNLSLPYLDDVSTTTSLNLANSSTNKGVLTNTIGVNTPKPTPKGNITTREIWVIWKPYPNSTVPVKASEEVLSKPKSKVPVKEATSEPIKGQVTTSKTMVMPKEKPQGTTVSKVPVNSSKTPKTVSVWTKSKFSDKWSYKDVPVIRMVDNTTLYRWWDWWQFWTPDRKYAEQFWKVKEKKWSFYQVDNGNRVTDVYVEAIPDTKVKVPVKEANPLLQEAKKYKSAEEFVAAYTANSLLDLSDTAKHRYWRLLEDGVYDDTMRYMDAKYTAELYWSEYKWYKEANLPNPKSKEDIVTIYRGTKKTQKEMLPWDFVSFSKDYALSHNDWEKLLTLKVPAKDVVRQGNDFNEWIYSPEKLRGGEKYNGGLEKIREEANGKTKVKVKK